MFEINMETVRQDLDEDVGSARVDASLALGKMGNAFLVSALGSEMQGVGNH